jgi:hypothetical protein
LTVGVRWRRAGGNVVSDIGIMVGLYIVMRVLEVLFPRAAIADRPRLPVLVAAVIAGVVAILAMVDLAVRGGACPCPLPMPTE